MKFGISGNKISILQDELDIYDAPNLRENILSAAKSNDGSVILDLHNVGSISTPIIQILLGARKSIGNFQVLNINNSVMRNLTLFGFSL